MTRSYTVGEDKNEGNRESLARGICYCNFTFMIAGIPAIMMGIYFNFKLEAIQMLVEGRFKPGVFCIILSIFLFILASIGYFAVFTEQSSIFYAYILMLGMFLVLFIPSGSIAFVISVKDFKSTNGMKEVWNTMNKYFEIEKSRNTIDGIQAVFQCCGLSDHGYRDWNRNFHFSCVHANTDVDRCNVPSSCCRPNETEYIDWNCGAGVLNSTSMSKDEIEKRIFTRGCLSLVDAFIKRGCANFGILSLASCLFVLTAFVLALVLMKFLKDKPEILQFPDYFVGMRNSTLLDQYICQEISLPNALNSKRSNPFKI